MRLISFLQVLLLLALVVEVVLITLENPALVRLPLPLGRGELTLSVGMAVTLFWLLGGLYALLLLAPPMWQEYARRRREAAQRRAAEQRLTATLQARLGAVPQLSAGASLALSDQEPAHPSPLRPGETT